MDRVFVRAKLTEATLKFLRSQIDAKNQTRSNPVTTKLVSISKEGLLQFKSRSITTDPGNPSRWTNFVQLLDWDEAMAQGDLNYSQKANLAVFGDLKLKCDCPAFLYWGYAYILSEYDANYEPAPDWEGSPGKENRPPVERNPNLEGIMCKHLVSVLYVLAFSISKVATRMKEFDKERKNDTSQPDSSEEHSE